MLSVRFVSRPNGCDCLIQGGPLNDVVPLSRSTTPADLARAVLAALPDAERIALALAREVCAAAGLQVTNPDFCERHSRILRFASEPESTRVACWECEAALRGGEGEAP